MLVILGYLSYLSFSPVHKSKNVEHGGHIWVIVSGGFLQILQGLFAEGHGHLVAALRGILDHQIVESPEASRDLVSSLLCCRFTAGLS